MNNSDGIRFKQARDEARRLSNVLFLGTMPPVEMESWFQRTKLFLNTSIREGFPNTFLQAWMNGVPVVSLNIDPDAIIERYGLGKIIGSEKVQQFGTDFRGLARLLVNSILELLDDDNLSKGIGEKALHYVESHHYPVIVVPRLIAALGLS